MKKSGIFALSTICFLSGILLGILCAPLSRGIGNNSGNEIHHHYYANDPEEE